MYCGRRERKQTNGRAHREAGTHVERQKIKRYRCAAILLFSVEKPLRAAQETTTLTRLKIKNCLRPLYIDVMSASHKWFCLYKVMFTERNHPKATVGGPGAEK